MPNLKTTEELNKLYWSIHEMLDDRSYSADERHAIRVTLRLLARRHGNARD